MVYRGKRPGTKCRRVVKETCHPTSLIGVREGERERVNNSAKQ